MQVIDSLYKLLALEWPGIHTTRLKALVTNVTALMRGKKLTVAGLGRSPGRHRNTASGRRAARKASQDHVRTQTQPWLIVTSLDPATHGAHQVMRLYKTRMQIELAFRDIKNTRAGLALRETRTRNPLRLANLLLIGMLASFCLWLIGRIAVEHGDHFRLQANTERKRPVLSLFFIACQLVAQNAWPTKPAAFRRGLLLVRHDMHKQSLA